MTDTNSDATLTLPKGEDASADGRRRESLAGSGRERPFAWLPRAGSCCHLRIGPYVLQPPSVLVWEQASFEGPWRQGAMGG